MNSKLCLCSDYHDSCIELIIGITNLFIFSSNYIGKFYRHVKYSLKIYPLIHLIPLFKHKINDFKAK